MRLHFFVGSGLVGAFLCGNVVFFGLFFDGGDYHVVFIDGFELGKVCGCCFDVLFALLYELV